MVVTFVREKQNPVMIFYYGVFLYISYGLQGISWVFADSVRDEIWTWEGICKGRKIVGLIPLTFFFGDLKREK